MGLDCNCCLSLHMNNHLTKLSKLEEEKKEKKKSSSLGYFMIVKESIPTMINDAFRALLFSASLHI